MGMSGLAGRTSPASEEAKPARKNEPKSSSAEEDVSALEDLMREHGALQRILLIYEEGLRRLHVLEPMAGPVRTGGAIYYGVRDQVHGGRDLAAIFHGTATLVRTFVEDYHEKLEEKFVFPEFERRGQLAPLVKVLREQHEAGRAVTDVILKAPASEFLVLRPRGPLVTACEAFLRMYRPHAAREDTVLFPALRKILPAARLDELGDKFEHEEDRLFGVDGFAKIVEQVAAIEQKLGIHDLGQFTAKTKRP